MGPLSAPWDPPTAPQTPNCPPQSPSLSLGPPTAPWDPQLPSLGPLKSLLASETPNCPPQPPKRPPQPLIAPQAPPPAPNRPPCVGQGAVVTLDCVERLIRKEMRDPVSGDPLTEGDIIVLQRGGTGFAGSGICLEAKKSRPVMQA
ncbi:uncharacterized protein ACIBXB_005441 [Morphnus guianensis]